MPELCVHCVCTASALAHIALSVYSLQAGLFSEGCACGKYCVLQKERPDLPYTMCNKS